ncbi:MAG TPA: hypothetical protein VGG28_17495 [Kofleriaceae bacterium]|jgi:hypothetical protein
MRSTLGFAFIVGLVVAACSSYSSTKVDGGESKCAGNIYDPCGSNGDCMSNFCHDYNGAGITVCTVTCTAGDNSTCPIDMTGSNGFCNNMGNCKPSEANVCGS